MEWNGCSTLHAHAEHASVLTVWRCVEQPNLSSDPKARSRTAPLVLEHQLAVPVGPALLLKPHEGYVERWWPFSLVAAMDGSVPMQVRDGPAGMMGPYRDNLMTRHTRVISF